MEIFLTVSQSLGDTCRAAGFPLALSGMNAHLPQPGDVITHPGCKGLALKVVARYLQLAHQGRPATWWLACEQAETQLVRTASVPPPHA